MNGILLLDPEGMARSLFGFMETNKKMVSET